MRNGKNYHYVTYNSFFVSMLLFKVKIESEILNTPHRESLPDIFHSNTKRDVKDQEVALNGISIYYNILIYCLYTSFK